jgi:hypothetical protein
MLVSHLGDVNPVASLSCLKQKPAQQICAGPDLFDTANLNQPTSFTSLPMLRHKMHASSTTINPCRPCLAPLPPAFSIPNRIHTTFAPTRVSRSLPPAAHLPLAETRPTISPFSGTSSSRA